MKTIALTLFLVSSSLFVAAQTQNQQRQRVRPTTPKKSAVKVGLDTNHKISLAGVLPNGEKVAVSTVGIGPDYRFSAPLNEESFTIASCSYSISENEGKYHLSYHVGIQVRLESGSGNYEYRDFMIEGKVVCGLEAPIEIFKSRERALTISVSNVSSESELRATDQEE